MSLNNLQQQHQQKVNIAILLITHVPCPQTIFELKIHFQYYFYQHLIHKDLYKSRHFERKQRARVARRAIPSVRGEYYSINHDMGLIDDQNSPRQQ